MNQSWLLALPVLETDNTGHIEVYKLLSCWSPIDAVNVKSELVALGVRLGGRVESQSSLVDPNF